MYAKVRSIQLTCLLPLLGFFFLLKQTYKYYSKFVLADWD